MYAAPGVDGTGADGEAGHGLISDGLGTLSTTNKSLGSSLGKSFGSLGKLGGLAKK